MPVNETFSTYSDWTYGAAVGVYVLAMVFSLVEQAFGRRATAPARELVGAGAPVEDGTDEPADAPIETSRRARSGQVAPSGSAGCPSR